MVDNIRKKQRWCVGLLCCLFIFILTACEKKPVGFKDNQVFQIGNEYVTKEQVAVLMCSLQKKYENMFGTDAWTIKFGDGTLNEYVKEQVKTQVVQLTSMNLLAADRKVTLTEEEKENAKKASEEFVKAFSDEQMKNAGFDEKDVRELYLQYALADKIYEKLTESVDKEISDDAARMIDLQVIFFYTNKNGEDGKKIDLGQEERQAVTQKAYEVWEKANAGENFESLASQYNEGTQFEYHIGRGEMEDAFEEAAFQLTDGQLSGLVEGEEGIYIIKCISNYNQTETDANKTLIYTKQCAEVFNEKYDKFMKNIKVKINKKVWDKISIVTADTLPDVDFLKIYENMNPLE